MPFEERFDEITRLNDRVSEVFREIAGDNDDLWWLLWGLVI